MTDWEEALIVELRRSLALPLDDITEAMRRCVNPRLSRSAIHRCLQRHAISARLTPDKAPAAAFQTAAPAGFIHIDVKYLPPLNRRRSYAYVAIDRSFDRLCARHAITHRLTRPFRPQTNGMVERFNRRLGDHLDRMPQNRAAHHRRFLDHPERDAYLHTFVADYNRTRLHCLDYHAPAELLAKLTGHNTQAGVHALVCNSQALLLPQSGHTKPFGQRAANRYLTQAASSAKRCWNSIKERGKSVIWAAEGRYVRFMC